MRSFDMATTMGIALAIAGAMGCTSTGTAPQPAKEPATLTAAGPVKACPLGVEGADVLVSDTPDGVVMTFTASPDKTDDLRERVRDAAAMHGPGQEVGKGHGGKHGEGGMHGLRVMQLPPVRAMAEDVEHGARLVLVPVDPADAASLRAKIRERAKDMAASCDR